MLVVEPRTVVPDDPLQTREFRVLRRRRHTQDTVTLTLGALDGAPFPFAPGQFTMLGRPGIGEVPISISGNPARPDRLEHTVRDVGGTTHPICTADVGSVLTVRGPYGTGWDVEDGAGGDVLVVAGGIGLAPLRPAVLALLAHRDRYRRVVVLYGTRSPADILFLEDLTKWRSRFDVEVQVTVDRAAADWRGRVGLVTGLFEMARFEPRFTLALICGPEVMLRLAAVALADHEVPPDRIRLSMERNMQCGVGLCGHCQLRELFVCLDGPVLPYDRLAPLLSVREL